MKQISVVAAVIECDGKILCMQRGNKGYDYTAMHWEFPGGKIEPGESPQQALHREILEEMNLDIIVGEHIATISHTYPDFHITLHFYRCRPTTPGIPSFTRREHIDHCWLAPAQLHSLDWCAADYPLIQLLQLK